MTRLRRLSWLNWASHALLAAGLFGPCMTVTPHLESVEGLSRWLGLLGEPKSYSVLTGVVELLRGGHLVIGLVLLVFSVIFPLAKLVAVRASLADARAGRPAGVAHALAARFSKYSMVDVFVIALLVVAGKSFPGGTTVEIRWGAYAFGAAALASMLASGAVAPARRPAQDVRVPGGGGKSPR